MGWPILVSARSSYVADMPRRKIPGSRFAKLPVQLTARYSVCVPAVPFTLKVSCAVLVAAIAGNIVARLTFSKTTGRCAPRSIPNLPVDASTVW